MLFSSTKYSPLLQKQRSDIIISRTRIFSIIFLFFILVIVAVDIIISPQVLWKPLALIHLFGISIIYLIIRWTHTFQLNSYQILFYLFVIVTVLNIGSEYHLFQHQNILRLYHSFMYSMFCAGLAIFPLTVFESISLLNLILAGFISNSLINLRDIDWISLFFLFQLSCIITFANASQLASMMTLIKQLMYDPLTGILSRRGGEELLNILQTNTKNTNLSVIFFDIDNFKEINDTYGHQVGDCVLRQFAQKLKKSCRREDYVIRWGGEEFLLILPNTTMINADLILKRLQKRGFGQRPNGFPLTASMGLAEWRNEGCTNWQQLVNIADQHMYRAKQISRNCKLDKIN